MELNRSYAGHRARALMVVLAAGTLVAIACAQQTATKEIAVPNQPAQPTLQHYLITPESLPGPDMATQAMNFPRVVPRPTGAELTMPPGFQIETYADNLDRPRWMALAPNGDIFVAESQADRITILRDGDGDGKPEQRFVFASKLARPFGMAFWKDYLYVGDTNALIRFKYKPGQNAAEGEPEKLADLPEKGYREHWTRNVLFSKDGSKVFVTVGSESNVDAEAEPMRAAIAQFNPDGTGKRIYASGTRNPIGLAFNPTTGALWAAVQERDRIGDDLVPDYLTSIKDGGFYGWPYSYIGQREEPRRKGERPDLVAKAIVPDVLIQAHSAVLGLTFYEGSMFPSDYRGDAFVALHGSWNRTKRTGYKIIRVRFKNGKPVGGYDDFIIGWMLGETSNEVWGRPVGLLVLKDGSMLIADDGGNRIWRVTHKVPGKK